MAGLASGNQGILQHGVPCDYNGGWRVGQMSRTGRLPIYVQRNISLINETTRRSLVGFATLLLAPLAVHLVNEDRLNRDGFTLRVVFEPIGRNHGKGSLTPLDAWRP